LLALGDERLAEAAAGAAAALAQAPDFRFEHRESFDAAALRGIRAQAEAARGAWSAALTALLPESTGGLEPADSQTWIVGGVRYPTFAGAVLAWLQQRQSVAA